jgi:ribonuclease III
MLLKDLELAFKDKNNFKKIFNQQVKFKKEFQRLEFLGDRVIGLILASVLYDTFKDFDEGSLAKLYSVLTSSVTIEKIAKKIGLDIFLEKYKINNITRKKLTDFMEAILGSLYIEQGLNKTRNIVIVLWEKEINNNKSIKGDPKSLLQEWSQAKNLGLPIYNFIKKSGPDHSPHFTVQINVQKYKSMIGEGKSIQDAQKIAAQIFIDKYLKDN